ncbi:MAG: caspase family protein [Planctomycetota bacterium]
MIAALVLSFLPAMIRRAGSLDEPRRLALIVGASNYGSDSLGFVRADCFELATLLRDKQRYSVRVWGDGIGDVTPKAKTEEALIEWMDEQWGGSGSHWDQVLFYYSGHGVKLGDRAYLALDTPLKSSEVQRTWMTPEAIVGFLEKKKTSALVVIDSCNSDGYTRAIEAHSAADRLTISLYASANIGLPAFARPVDVIDRSLAFELGVVSDEDLREVAHNREHCSKYLGPGEVPKHSTFNYFFCRALLGWADGVVLNEPRHAGSSCEEGLDPAAYTDFGIDLDELSSYVAIAMCANSSRLETQEPWLRRAGRGGGFMIIPSATAPLARLQKESKDRLEKKCQAMIGKDTKSPRAQVVYEFEPKDLLCTTSWTRKTFCALEEIALQCLGGLPATDNGRKVFVYVGEDENVSTVELRPNSRANRQGSAWFQREGDLFTRKP